MSYQSILGQGGKGPMPKDVYEVLRGIKFDEKSFRGRFSDLVYSAHQQDLLTLAREVEKDGQGDYSGVTHSNRFRVNGRIHLLQLGFLGPAVQKEATYTVFLEVLEPTKRNPFMATRRIAKLNQKITVERGELYFVNFAAPVNINPGVWYEIKFCLEGPDTARCEKTYREATADTPKGTFQFEFLEGSKQMPVLRFNV